VVAAQISNENSRFSELRLLIFVAASRSTDRPSNQNDVRNVRMNRALNTRFKRVHSTAHVKFR
jgi:hypothetical protein